VGVIKSEFSESIEHSIPPSIFSFNSHFLEKVNGTHLPSNESIMLVVVFACKQGKLGLVEEVNVDFDGVNICKGWWEVVVVF
jgi:hypothetical protein